MIQTYDDIDALPRRLRIYGASDYATMERKKGKKDPDFTEHGVVGMDSQGDLWFIDWWFGQVETDKSITAFTRLLIKHTPVRWWNEGGLIDKAIGPAIRRGMREANKFVHVESLPSIQDKGAKLQSFHARVTAGTVHFPIKRAWADRCIDQLVKFPAGRFDDAADVCGLLGRGIDQMMNAELPPDPERPNIRPFTAEWLEYDIRNQRPKERFF